MIGAGLPLALVAASTAVSAAGAIAGGIAESKSAKFNASVAEQNAQLAKQQAEQNALKVRRNVNRVLGRQRTAIAKSGLMGPTAADVASDSMVEGELDALNTLYQGEMTAYNYNQEASMQKNRSKSAMTSGMLGALGSIASGAVSGYYMNSQLNPTVSPFEKYASPIRF